MDPQNNSPSIYLNPFSILMYKKQMCKQRQTQNIILVPKYHLNINEIVARDLKVFST